MTDTRCEISDLPTWMCGHCQGHHALPVEPTPIEPPRATGRVVWSPMHSHAAVEPPATVVVSGPQNGGNECGCGRPTRNNRVICDTCTDEMDRALGDVTWLAEELDTSIARQRSAPIVSGPRSASNGLPWHDRAAEATRNRHNLLVLWVRMCAEESIGTGPADLPADNLTALARWLLHRVPGLAMHDAAADAHDEITNAVAECERVVFYKRRSRAYLGTCGQRTTDQDGNTLLEVCPGEVYAEHDQPVGYCDDCHQGVTVVIRQGELNRQLDDRLYTAAELARLAVILGLDAPRDRVRKKIHYWHRHKRITQRGTITEHTKDGPVEVPTFRYGEVRVMLYSEFGADTA